MTHKLTIRDIIKEDISYIYSRLKTIDLINMRNMIDKELVDRGIRLCEI